MGETSRRKPDENTVIGTAKTMYAGRLIYVDILYGNVVRLPDGTQSSVDPAIYAKLLEAYLNISDAEETDSSKTAENETISEQEDFLDSSLYVLQEGEFTQQQIEKAEELHSDRESFFYREDSDSVLDETEESEQVVAEQNVEEETFAEPDDNPHKPEAAYVADTDDEVPGVFTKSMKKRRNAIFLGVCISVLMILLVVFFTIF